MRERDGLGEEDAGGAFMGKEKPGAEIRAGLLRERN
jgi:hypothetical protein